MRNVPSCFAHTDVWQKAVLDLAHFGFEVVGFKIRLFTVVEVSEFRVSGVRSKA